MKQSTITVLGAGYVGLTTAALLAHAGYKVYAIEPNQKRLEVIKQGRSFFYEQGLDVIIKTAIDSGKLIATDSYADSIPSSNVVFSCVGTPDSPDGSSNLSYVYGSAEESAKYLQPGSIYVQKSTVPVGTGKEIELLFKKLSKDISYVSNPEFLRESTALYDTLYFDRVVVGGDNRTSVEHVLDIYRQLESHRDDIAKLAETKTGARNGKYIATSLNSAELIKVTANAFLALKISFANSIAKLADKVDADVVEVMDAVGADERIGRAFLNAGRGYGGGCFPKDVSGLIASAEKNGVAMDIMTSAQDVNSSMPDYIVDKLKSLLNGDIDGKSVAVLGLAFKGGTSDARKSPGIKLANILVNEGATVKAFDPEAIKEEMGDLSPGVELLETVESVLKSTDVIIVATEWKQFIDISGNEYKRLSNAEIFVAAINHFDKKTIADAGMTYIGVGR